MFEKLETENLQQIRLNHQDIIWEKPGEELRIGEQLFDVKYQKKFTDHIVFYGLFDSKETELKKVLEKKDQKKQTNAFSSGLIQWMGKFQFSNSYAEELNKTDHGCVRKFISACFNLPATPFIPSFIPPPDCSFR